MGLEALLEAEIVDERNIITGVYLIGSAYFVSTYVRRRRNPKSSSSLHILVNTLAGDVGDPLLAVMCNEYGPLGDVESDCVRPRCPIVCLCGVESHMNMALVMVLAVGEGQWGIKESRVYAHASLKLSPGHALKVRYLPLCYIAGPSELYPLVPITVLGCTCSLLVTSYHLKTKCFLQESISQRPLLVQRTSNVG